MNRQKIDNIPHYERVSIPKITTEDEYPKNYDRG
jgi:hypothetical protein